VSSFAAAFPTDGPPSARRYFVFIMLDEPHPDKTGADPTGGIVAAPAVGKVIERIAPFVGIKRRAELVAFDPGPVTPDDAGEER
jgi:cell division protein FtsI (penicillin-binding protein 3)